MFDLKNTVAALAALLIWSTPAMAIEEPANDVMSS